MHNAAKGLTLLSLLGGYLFPQEKLLPMHAHTVYLTKASVSQRQDELVIVSMIVFCFSVFIYCYLRFKKFSVCSKRPRGRFLLVVFHVQEAIR